ncbi:hypothetical protein [Agrobacterium rosae]|uniref:hypothetical protein n=1 Tax=Agrobacterium rosae TaxID=1972867 RepID=UPI002033AA81|nr:hypothetical protein [Agrobacterium rosae]MCM2432099.1 hypothetical protein [Agrobacterium rosae]
MDSWLKALIASACVVVIAGGGYYASGEYRSYQRENERRETVGRQASVMDREAQLKARYSTEECLRMAKDTLPDTKGGPTKTTQYNDDLSKCDDLNRFDAEWRQALDMAGVF